MEVPGEGAVVHPPEPEEQAARLVPGLIRLLGRTITLGVLGVLGQAARHLRGRQSSSGLAAQRAAVLVVVVEALRHCLEPGGLVVPAVEGLAAPPQAMGPVGAVGETPQGMALRVRVGLS